MRYLKQYARAVARVRLASARAAMVKVRQNFQCVADQLVGFCTLHVNDETEAAGIMLELRVIKPLFRRRGNLSLRTPVVFILLSRVVRHLWQSAVVHIFFTQNLPSR